MKIVKIIVIAIAVILGLLIVVGLFLPTEMKTEKSIVIDTPPNIPYSQVANLRNMSKWDPWSRVDSNMEATYEGALVGVGAKRSWKSKHDNVGMGSMIITKAEQFSFIDSDLDFGDQGKATSYYKFEEIEEGKTKVTWGFYSDVDFPIMGGYIAAMMGPKIEEDFEEGLISLKKLSEGIENKSDLSGRKITLEKVDLQKMVCISGSSTQDDPNLAQKFGEAYGKLMSNIQVNGMEMAGPPLTVTTHWGENKYEYQNCIPVNEIKGDLSATVVEKTSYEGTAVKIEHIGPYAEMEPSYDAIMAYIEQFGFEMVGFPWEVYINDPTETPEDKLITHIYFPIK